MKCVHICKSHIEGSGNLSLHVLVQNPISVLNRKFTLRTMCICSLTHESIGSSTPSHACLVIKGRNACSNMFGVLMMTNARVSWLKSNLNGRDTQSLYQPNKKGWHSNPLSTIWSSIRFFILENSSKSESNFTFSTLGSSMLLRKNCIVVPHNGERQN